MRHIVFSCLLALSVLFPLMAQAQGVNADARAQILKGQIEGFLENQKAMALKNGCLLDAKGATTVEKANGYYAFTLPLITYTDSKGVRSEIGMIALNAVPEGEFDWKISMALPTPINSFSSKGTQQFKTDIGSQTISGVWNEKLGHFTSVDAKLANVQLNDLLKQSTMTVGALNFASSLTERDVGTYTGNAKWTMDNIAIYDATTSFKTNLAKIVLDTNLADRASKAPMTKDEVKNRPQSAHPDFYNIFSMLFGAPERVTAKVTGLDAISAELQQSMLTAKPDQRQHFLQAVLGVSAVSGMGKPVANDASTKLYDVLFTREGAITVNGTDFGSLLNPTSPAAGQPVLQKVR